MATGADSRRGGRGALPVTIITGFHGAGKTGLLLSLLPQVLTPPSYPLSVAVIVNSLIEGDAPSTDPKLECTVFVVDA